MDHVYCTECGAENPVGNTFCTNCGAPLDKSFLEDGTAESPKPAADGPEGDGIDAEVYLEEEVFDTGDLGGTSPGETTFLPQPTPQPRPQPAPAPEPAPAAPPSGDGPRRNGTGKIVGIAIASVTGVLAAAFAIFYLTNPFGLTTGIFANSAAAQAAAAAEAQQAAEEAQREAEEQAEQSQKEAEEAQKRADEAQQAQQEAEEAQKKAEEEKAEAEARRKAEASANAPSEPVPDSSGYVGPNGIEYVHHVYTEYSDDYILPDSARRVYSLDELSGLSNYELYLARNEIFARYGRMYEEADLRDHYLSTDWYIPLYDGGDFDSVLIEDYLNENEYKNVILIRDYERDRGSEYL